MLIVIMVNAYSLAVIPARASQVGKGRSRNTLSIKPCPSVRFEFRPTRVNLLAQPNMEVSQTIQCPYCGQSFTLVVDTSTPRLTFTVDCEVCCRLMEVIAECEPGEVLSLNVAGA